MEIWTDRIKEEQVGRFRVVTETTVFGRLQVALGLGKKTPETPKGVVQGEGGSYVLLGIGEHITTYSGGKLLMQTKH